MGGPEVGLLPGAYGGVVSRPGRLCPRPNSRTQARSLMQRSKSSRGGWPRVAESSRPRSSSSRTQATSEKQSTNGAFEALAVATPTLWSLRGPGPQPIAMKVSGSLISPQLLGARLVVFFSVAGGDFSSCFGGALSAADFCGEAGSSAGGNFGGSNRVEPSGVESAAVPVVF